MPVGGKSEQEIRSELAKQLEALDELEEIDGQVLPAPEDLESLLAGFSEAGAARQRTEQVLAGVYDDLRRGRKLELGKVEGAVTDLVGQMERNREAMLGLTLLTHHNEAIFAHASNVAILLMAFGFSLNLKPVEVRSLGLGGLLHDLGIVRVPNSVLAKKGRLAPRERKLVERHPLLGAEMLKRMRGLSGEVRLIVAQHHERFDGSGYPKRLFRNQAHRFAQMASIVDTFEAITGDRPYHKATAPHQALGKMLQMSRTHFQAELFQQFIHCIGIYPVGSLLRFRNQLMGLVVRQNPGNLLLPVVKVFFNTQTRTQTPQQVVNLLDSRNKDDFEVVGPELPEKWGMKSQVLLRSVLGMAA